MSLDNRAFRPLADAQTTAQTGSSVLVALNNTNGFRSLRVVNTGAAIMYVKFGGAGVTVTAATGAPVLPNTEKVFTLDKDQTHMATIGTATQNLITQVGVGR